MARLFNLATEGVKARLGFHICFGNRFGRSHVLRSYEPSFSGVLSDEPTSSRWSSRRARCRRSSSGRSTATAAGLGAGLMDVKGFNQDTAEHVAWRIRKVLQHCSAEKITLNPDCGFGWSPRYMCNQKLASLVAGARVVRAELAGR